MAGYLVNFSDFQSLISSARNGVYGTILKPSSRGAPYWLHHHESTIGDYATMEAGDNIYFFYDRKIYGIGKLVDIGTDCKYLNFPSAGQPTIPKYETINGSLLLDSGPESHRQRVVCFFKPAPNFFSGGVDMDDVLSSNPPAFRNLRVMWRRSFIKFDDEENQAFKDILLKRNQKYLTESGNEEAYINYNPELHRSIKKYDLTQYRLSLGINEIIHAASDGEEIRHEMAVELGLLERV